MDIIVFLNILFADIDAFPPGKVTDLMVTVEEGKEELRLSWTATGADLDQGIGRLRDVTNT